MGIIIFEKYSEFVERKINQYPRGDNLRGLTKLFMWSLFWVISIIFLIIVFKLLFTNLFWGLIVILILFLIEIGLRYIKKNST